MSTDHYALSFDEHDLEFNRDGNLSARQHKDMTASHRLQVIISTLFVVGVAGFGIWNLLVVRNPVLGIALLLVGAVIGGSLYNLYRKTLGDVTVAQVTAELGKHKDPRGNYFVLLDDVKIIVPRAMYDAVDEGRTYTFYYVQRDYTTGSMDTARPVAYELVAETAQ